MNDTNPEHLTLSAAREYLRRGYVPVPIPARKKAPVFTGWQNFRVTADRLPHHFNGAGNIGLLLGAPSGWLVDVDLDCPEARELAAQYLPPTPAKTGRPGSPASHWWYVAEGAETAQHRDPLTKKMIIELRSTGGQTLVGPSIHPSGEPYDLLDQSPARCPAPLLTSSVEALAKQIVEQRHGGPPETPDQAVPNGNRPVAEVGTEGVERRAIAYLDAMPAAISGEGGHAQTYAAATALVHGFCIEKGRALSILLEHYNSRCQPPWTEKELLHKVDEAASKPHDKPLGWLRDARRSKATDRAAPAPSKGTPVIVIDTDEHRVIEETVAALRADPNLYQRGGILVRVVRDRQPTDGILRCEGSATIQRLPNANLRDRMTRYAMFTKVKGPGELRPVHPSMWLVNGVEARAEWEGIRHLMGISDTPILRPDGSIWQQAGHDSTTGVLFEPATSESFPTIPANLTIDDARAALEVVMEVVCDFPFESEEHKAAWVAGLLTPLARFAFAGPSPLFLIDANVRGAGKGLLVQGIGRIVLGRDLPVSSYAHDGEEMRKKLTSIAIAGDRMIHFDNLEGVFGNDALDRALTCTRWKDRILGRSEEVELPLIPCWYATGNNVQVAADTTRRVIHIRLDCLEERPEERTNFRHGDLIAWITENRARLLTAALTILAAYLRSDRPSQNLTPFGSFEGWSQIVREAIVWVGQPDPCLTRTKLAASADTTLDALEQLLDAWERYDASRKGLILSPTLNALYRDSAPYDEAAIAMRAALENIVECPPGKAPTAKQVGNKLRTFRRRVVNGRMLDIDPGRRREGKLWRLLNSAGQQ